MLNLQPIKARLAAATPGPWTASPNVQPHGIAAVAEVNTVLVLSSGPLYGSPAQDANLIANAPNDLAALVAEVERLREAIKAHREQSHKTYKVSQAWWDEDLWAVLDD